jgi:hypothetical protein
MVRLLAVFGLLAGLWSGAAGAAGYETLHVFPFKGTFSTPSAPLLMNPAGTAIYGVMKSNDAPFAYALTLKPSGRWTETTLYNFPVDLNSGGIGCYLSDGIAQNSQGNIFGTNTGCYPENDFGSLYEISPPARAGAPWTGKVIHRFGQNLANGKGDYDPAEIFLDEAGNIYGGASTAHNTSGLYKFTRPAAPGKGWSGGPIASLNDKYGDGFSWVLRDAQGNLYGTGNGDGLYVEGSIWKLTPARAFSVLATFPSNGPGGVGPSEVGPKGIEPTHGVIMDASGNLYGTTQSGGAVGYGVVFQAVPPTGGAGAWTINVLHSFAGTDGSNPSGLTIDKAGNLYGVAIWGGNGWQKGQYVTGEGVIYELSPPATAGAAWKFTILHKPATTFFTPAPTAINPGLILGPDGKLYGTAGGPMGSGGSVFRVTP